MGVGCVHEGAGVHTPRGQAGKGKGMERTWKETGAGPGVEGSAAAGTGTQAGPRVPDGLTEQRRELVENVMRAMQEKGLSWTRGWASGASPYNYSSGRRYNGINRVYLSWLSAARGTAIRGG